MENQSIQVRNEKIRKQFVYIVIDKSKFWSKIIEAGTPGALQQNEPVSDSVMQIIEPTINHQQSENGTDTFALSIDEVNRHQIRTATEPLEEETQTYEQQTQIVDVAHGILTKDIRILRDTYHNSWVCASLKRMDNSKKLLIHSPCSRYKGPKLSIEFRDEIDRLFGDSNFIPRLTAVYNQKCKKADENRRQDEFLFALATALCIQFGQNVFDFEISINQDNKDTKHLRKTIQNLLLRSTLPMDASIEDVWTHP